MLPEPAAHAIATYTRPGDLVLDPMCGIGATLVESLRLGRHALGIEYEPRWATLARAPTSAIPIPPPATTGPPHGSPVATPDT